MPWTPSRPRTRPSLRRGGRSRTGSRRSSGSARSRSRPCWSSAPRRSPHFWQVRRAGGRSAIAATVEMKGREPTVSPSSDGRRLHATGLLADVRRAALDGGSVTARFVPSKARYSTADAERAAELARDLTGTPVYVFFEGRPLRTLAPHELARLVEF